jgi:hypothetical protein
MTAETQPLIVVGQTGPKNAWTTDDGLRFYRWQDRELPSVTTVRRMAGIPHTLHQWSLTQVVNRVLDDFPGLGAMLRTGTPEAVEGVRLHLRRAATEERDRKAALGTAVHDAAALGRSLVEVPAEVAPFLRQYLDWLARSRAEILLAERQVWSLEVGYAGTFDLTCRFPDGSLWIVDLKTGSGIYPDHALQLAAYRYAEFVGADDTIDEDATGLLRQVTGTAVLHLSQRKWEFHSIVTGPQEWRAFRGLLAFAMWSHEHAAIEDFSIGSRKGAA